MPLNSLFSNSLTLLSFPENLRSCHTGISQTSVSHCLWCSFHQSNTSLYLTIILFLFTHYTTQITACLKLQPATAWSVPCSPEPHLLQWKLTYASIFFHNSDNCSTHCPTFSLCQRSEYTHLQHMISIRRSLVSLMLSECSTYLAMAGPKKQRKEMVIHYEGKRKLWSQITIKYTEPICSPPLHPGNPLGFSWIA